MLWRKVFIFFKCFSLLPIKRIIIIIKEIINTIQGQKLQIVGAELPYKINISLKEFEFDKVILNQILITDLILIVKKVI